MKSQLGCTGARTQLCRAGQGRTLVPVVWQYQPCWMPLTCAGKLLACAAAACCHAPRFTEGSCPEPTNGLSHTKKATTALQQGLQTGVCLMVMSLIEVEPLNLCGTTQHCKHTQTKNLSAKVRQSAAELHQARAQASASPPHTHTHLCITNSQLSGNTRYSASSSTAAHALTAAQPGRPMPPSKEASPVLGPGSGSTAQPNAGIHMMSGAVSRLAAAARVVRLVGCSNSDRNVLAVPPGTAVGADAACTANTAVRAGTGLCQCCDAGLVPQAGFSPEDVLPCLVLQHHWVGNVQGCKPCSRPLLVADALPCTDQWPRSRHVAGQNSTR